MPSVLFSIHFIQKENKRDISWKLDITTSFFQLNNIDIALPIDVLLYILPRPLLF